jgi:hypothetical protein
MGKIGMKLSKAFSSLGNKTQKLTNKIGDKTHKVINEAKDVAGVLKKKALQIGNTATNAFDKTKDFVNKIPDINEKAIKLGNTIINKSGKVSNVLRKTSGIVASVTKGLASMGGDIPLVGSALKAGSKATDLLAKGAKRLDNARDNASTKLNKYSDVSRETINDIEKQNQRKKQANEASNQNDGNDGFM